ncbi:MAG: MBL fold metallo-hydrolase [Candidatus Aenigmatarchaeota archaeon]
MKILPIAFDSFGVRSQATKIITDFKIFIDPGIALGPYRYGLEPSKEEFEALEILRKKIIEEAKDCKIFIVTHYHYDHHPFPDDDEMYSLFDNKVVLIKDINKDIHHSGKTRGRLFYERIKNRASEIIFCDAQKLKFGSTLIKFSKGVWHGEENSQVGKVLMVSIEYKNKKFLFGSDAQSLANKEALDFAIEENPDFAIIDGFPTLFLGYRMSKTSFLNAKTNLMKFLKESKVKKIILDHHIVRDISYKEKISDIFGFAKNFEKEVCTAAEYYGLENLFLEVWRDKLHKKEVDVNVKNYLKELFKKIKNKKEEE